MPVRQHQYFFSLHTWPKSCPLYYESLKLSCLYPPLIKEWLQLILLLSLNKLLIWVTQVVYALLFTDILFKTALNAMEYDIPKLKNPQTGDFSASLTIRKFVGVDLAWNPHRGAQSASLSSIFQERKNEASASPCTAVPLNKPPKSELHNTGH